MSKGGAAVAAPLYAMGEVMANTAAKLVSNAKKYIGLNEHDGSYKILIDTYNKLDPLPLGYRVKYSDAWCAAGLTAIFMLSGMKHLVPAECGVQRMLEKAKSAGCTEINSCADALPGDILFYDWNKDGFRDHVGIIENIIGSVFTVIECNYNDSVGRRVINKKSPTINGIIRPAYDEYKVQDGYKIQYAYRKNNYYAGRYKTTASDYLNLRTGAGTQYPIIEQILPGERITCYGYYNMVGADPWLYVIHDKTGNAGYCSYKYLENY